MLRVFKGAEHSSSGQDVLVPEGLRAKLNKLWAWKVREGESVDADAPLFVSRLGQRLSLRQVRHGFRVWQERAGFERRVTFHMVRHTACSNLSPRPRTSGSRSASRGTGAWSRRWSTRTRATTTLPAPSRRCGVDRRCEGSTAAAGDLLAVSEVTTQLIANSERLRSLSPRGPVSFPDGPRSKRAPGTLGETMPGSEISTTPHPPPEGASALAKTDPGSLARNGPGRFRDLSEPT